MFDVDPSMICKEGGELSLLLGQDTVNLLLKPVSDIKGKEVSKYLPEIAKDLSLQLTPASDKYSICGAIGGGDPMETSCRLFKSSMYEDGSLQVLFSTIAL